MVQAECIGLATRKRGDQVGRLVGVCAALLLSGGLTTYTRAADLEGMKDPLAVGNSQDWSRFDPYRVKEFNIPLPGPQETITQDAGGLRDIFASYGIGWLGLSNSFYVTNAASHGTPIPQTYASQQYSGQLPTYVSQNTFFLTFDLNRVGLKDGQLLAGVGYQNSNWPIAGENIVTMASLIYYQPLFNKAIEVQVGYLPSSLEYFSTFVGGNIAGGIFGPNGQIPFEAGLGATVFPTLGATVQFNLPRGFYDKVGIERATSPGGPVVDAAQNDNGFATSVPHGGVEYINEFGFRQQAAPDQLKSWYRAAVTYNTSEYLTISPLTGPGGGPLQERTQGEHGIFLLADQQILQTSAENPVLGLYIGGSWFQAPQELNVFTQNWEGRVYMQGPIPGRPFDQLSFVYSDGIFSPAAVKFFETTDAAADHHGAKLGTHPDAKSYTLAYNYRLFHGFYVNTAVSYVDHPTAINYFEAAQNPIGGRAGSTAATGSALNVYVGAAFFF